MQKLFSYIDENQENMLKNLDEFISIASFSNDKENLDKALDYILVLARSMGFKSEAVLEKQVGIIELGEGDETLGILAHVDVVSVGDINLWETDPFTMTEKDGKLFGRGTIGDKGAIIASLYALKEVNEEFVAD